LKKVVASTHRGGQASIKIVRSTKYPPRRAGKYQEPRAKKQEIRPIADRWGPQFLCVSAPLREKKESAAAESHTEWTTISLRLCALPAEVGLCEKKIPAILRGKPPRRKERPNFLNNELTGP